jgi:AraC-like DNA-binding protein
MLFQKIISVILLIFVFPLFCNGQDSLSNQSNNNNSPQTLQLSHIEIKEQYIDFRKLEDPVYRQNLDFGSALRRSFDSVATHFNYPLNLHLPHNLNDLTFHFSAIDWKAPHKIQYSYLLEGLDLDWSTPSSRSMITYQNLPPGSYILMIKAIGEAQTWSAPFTYPFHISKPWWRSNLAYTFYTVLLVGMGFMIFKYQKEKIKQEAEIQRLLEAYQTTDFPKTLNKKELNKENSFLILVQTTLKTHLSDENFGIAELCELLNISRAQLHRRIKKMTGLSTSHYIRSLRLEIAQSLLEQSDLNVSEVAFKVGFSSPAYFSKVFKSQFGHSPRELR